MGCSVSKDAIRDGASIMEHDAVACRFSQRWVYVPHEQQVEPHKQEVVNRKQQVVSREKQCEEEQQCEEEPIPNFNAIIAELANLPQDGSTDPTGPQPNNTA